MPKASTSCRCPLCGNTDERTTFGDSATGKGYINCNACKSQTFARGPDSDRMLRALVIAQPAPKPAPEPIHDEPQQDPAPQADPAPHEQPIPAAKPDRHGRFFRNG